MTLQLASNGSVEHRALWGEMVDQILAAENGGGDVAWMLTDHLGTVRDVVSYDAVTDVTTVDNHITYDSFGERVSETNATLDVLALGFTARWYDRATGLQWNLNRWYNAQLQKWMSEDPIGFAGGQENVGVYVGNDPVNNTDPSGLLIQLTPHTGRVVAADLAQAGSYGEARKRLLFWLVKGGIRATQPEINEFLADHGFNQPVPQPVPQPQPSTIPTAQPKADKPKETIKPKTDPRPKAEPRVPPVQVPPKQEQKRDCEDQYNAGIFKDLKRVNGGQRHHLNQHGAYGYDKPMFEIDKQMIIPYTEAEAVELTGNTYTPGTQHYAVHNTLEAFWHPYRKDQPLENKRPTNAQYLTALGAGLKAANFCPDTVAKLVGIAAAEQDKYKLKPTDFVPVVPLPIPGRWELGW